MNFSELLSILPFVVQEYLGNASDSKVTLYSGILAGSYALFQLIAQFPLGLASDKFGRKPILLLGLAAIGLSNVFLIFNTSYIGALLVRSACGFLVANNAIVRSYITESTEGIQRTQALTTINTWYILGFIAGPTMSGFLSRPSRLIESTYFSTHPYFLTFIVLSILSLIAFIATVALLQESKGQSTASQPLMSQQFTLESENEQPISARMAIRILKQNQVFKGTVVSSCLMQFVLGLIIEGFALWAKASKVNGGLEWDSNEDWIGVVYMSGGFSTLICASMVISAVINWLGDAGTVGISNVLSVPLVLALGFAQLIESKPGAFIYILIIWILWNAVTSTFLISNSLLMNNSIDKRVLGSANGISSGFGAVARAMGPLAAGFIFSWTFSNGLTFPMNFWLPFVLSAILATIARLYLRISTSEIN